MKDIDLIYVAARALPETERAAYLEKVCGGDAALRMRVEQMLAVTNQAEAFFPDLPDDEDAPLPEGEAGRTPEPSAAVDDAVGSILGHYRLLERIGEGGCGVVYVAKQVEPVRRRVALKVIKLGMDTKHVVARFEAERQALAMMDHPNIAKVLDAGTTKVGRPYFVMELVRGVRITDYCEQAGLSTRERIDLFVRVCHAIQHAHQKGVIHRDIKPSNILVTLHDGVPVPKVIDFGIAKATEGRLTDDTVYTQLHHFIGTPAYMSPEQAEISGLDIDTRSDIYSLGVLLYELLTGSTPFDPKELLASGLDAMRKTIREKEPLRPSTKLSQTLMAAEGKKKSATAGKPSSEDEGKASSRRQLRARETISFLKGDLDWIVMKCLEKDRARRYETANGLASDLNRHLNNEPVAARPASAAYRFQKAFRRNKLTFAATGAVAVTLLLGAIVSSWQAMRATHARHAEIFQATQARMERDRALQAQSTAVQQRDLAEQRLYDSLVREAHSIRAIRPLGFRPQLLDRLQKALAVSAALKDTNVLRTELAQCLGDAIGFAPVTLAEPPASFTDAAVNRDGTLVAYATSRGKLSLHETTNGQVIGRLEIKGSINGLAFMPDGNSLLGFALDSGKTNAGNAAPPRVLEWRRGSDGSWWQQSERAVPGLQRLITTTQGPILVIEDSAPLHLRLVDATANTLLGTIPWTPGQGFPKAFDVSSDFRLAAYVVNSTTTLSGAMMEVWDLKSGHRRAQLATELGRFHHLHFNPDSTLLAGTAPDGVIVFETTLFKSVNTYREFMGPRAIWCADGTRLAIPRAQDNAVRLCSPFAGTESARVTTPHQVKDVRCSLDGSVLLIIPLQGPTQIARLNGTTERRRLAGHVGGVTGVAFSPDGRVMASTGKDGTIRIWDLGTGKMSRNWTIPGGVPGQSVAFSLDGRWLASGNYQNNVVHVWRVEDGQFMLQLGEESTVEGTWTVCFSPDGRMLVAAGDGMRGWEITPRAATDSGPQLDAREVFRFPGFARNLHFHPTGKWVGFEGNVRQGGKSLSGSMIRGLKPQSEVELVHGHNYAVQTLGVAEGGRALLHMSKERTLLFLHPQSHEVLRQLPTLTSNETVSTTLRNFQVSADGARVATANHNGRGIDITEVASGRRLYTLPDEDAPIWWLAWHPGGRQLAVARSDGDISLWDLPKVEAVLAEVGLAP